MIPVKNIYFLLLYAWDVFDEGAMASVEAEPDTDLLNLLSSVLIRGIDQLLRRGLDRGYLGNSEQFAGVRGKCDLSATVKANLLHRGRTVCRYDDLSHDILHNQILKATLRNLLQTDTIDSQLQARLRMTWLRLPAVRPIQLSHRVFRSVQLHRNIRIYRFLIDLCRLLFDQLIPDQRNGVFRFREFTRDEERMSKLFERFLLNFYKNEQEYFTARPSRFRWATSGGPGDDILPMMVTDVTLMRRQHQIVIDAKFSPKALQQSLYGSPTLRSPHLYQLFAYMMNLPVDAATQVDGLIIYPLGTVAVDATVNLSGHSLRVYTLNLNQHWKMITRDLLALVVPHGA